MRLLDRYLLRELLMPLVYCLGGFVVFWISFNLFTRLDDLQEAKLHLWDVVELCAAWTPECVVTILPIALLLALLYTLTHHARHNEITALRAAGVSLWRLCVPYFVVGFGASLVLFALNEIGVPRSSAWAERILNRYIHKSDDAPESIPRFHQCASQPHLDFQRISSSNGRNVRLDRGQLDLAGWFHPEVIR